jgi:flagellar assembly factor FliW
MDHGKKGVRVALKVETSRFGTVEVSEDQIISFPFGLIGFPEPKRYALLPHGEGSPFVWLQSIDQPSLAFVLIDPFLVKADYEAEVSQEDTRTLELNGGASDLRILSIVNISKGEPKAVTANLLGPIVFNSGKRLAKQVVLDGRIHSHRFPVAMAEG